jgi:branched-chain amino acid transport system ATP-binding protein
MSQLLQVRDLTVSYGGVTAEVDHATFDLGAGEVLGILGPNGAGKTSLVSAILGLVRPIGGSIVLEGVDLSNLPTEERVKRGLVLVRERRKVFGSLTVHENLLVSCRGMSRRAASARAAEIYDIFPHLASRPSQLAGTLSGGEQQLLALGRAVALAPRVLLLDEPSLGLSPFHVGVTFDSIRRIGELGVSVVVVEQFVQKTREVADLLSIMARGQLGHPRPESEVADNEIRSAYLPVGVTQTRISQPKSDSNRQKEGQG